MWALNLKYLSSCSNFCEPRLENYQFLKFTFTHFLIFRPKILHVVSISILMQKSRQKYLSLGMCTFCLKSVKICYCNDFGTSVGVAVGRRSGGRLATKLVNP